MKTRKLTKAQIKNIEAAISFMFDVALDDNVKLKKVINNNPCYLGSESWTKRVIHYAQEFNKLGRK